MKLTRISPLPLTALALFLGAAPFSRSEDIYVAQNPIGAATGADATDAYAVTFLNSAADWSSPVKVPGKIGPGDTVHLCGTISTPLVVHAAGIPSAVITILFEPGAVMAAPNWNQGGTNGDSAISTEFGYVTIDGGTNGVIEATSNGTGLTTAVYNTGVFVSASSNVTVQNLCVKNLYVRLAGTDPSGPAYGGIGIYFYAACNNCLIQHCTVNDVYMPVEFAYSTCSTFEIANCTLFNLGDGIVVGSENYGCVLTGALIHNNIVTLGANWEGCSSIHRECVHAFAVQASPTPATLNGLKIYNNVFSGDLANNATGYCFLEGFVMSPDVYSNLFVQPNANSGGNGFLVFKGTETSMAMNNTFIGFSGGTEIAIDAEDDTLGNTILGHNLTIENNSFCGCSTAIYDAGPMTVESDYNQIYGSPYFYDVTFKTLLSLAKWTADTGFDVHSATVATSEIH